MDGKSRIDKLKSLLGERILVIDGAVGTAIQDLNLGPEDFGGPEFEGCNEYLVLTRPDLVAAIHQSYLDAGADILENAIAATWKLSIYNATDDIMYVVNLATPYNEKSPLDSIHCFLVSVIFILYLFYDLESLFVFEQLSLMQISFSCDDQEVFDFVSDA